MKNWIRYLLFSAGGGLAGLGYYHFFGCANGCPITSNPWLTIVYFAVIGLLLAPIFPKRRG